MPIRTEETKDITKKVRNTHETTRGLGPKKNPKINKQYKDNKEKLKNTNRKHSQTKSQRKKTQRKE